MIVSDVTLLELIPLLSLNYYYFIITKSQITHTVSRHHINSEPVKVALFALTAEFEDVILKLLMKDLTKVNERYAKLSEPERTKIEKRCKKYFPKDKKTRQTIIDIAVPCILYIQHTFFSQKIEILKNSPDLLHFAFPDADQSILFEELDFIKKVRNEMAPAVRFLMYSQT